MHIRKANLSDTSQLAEIHVKAWQTAYAGIMPSDYLSALNVETRSREWDGWINEPGPGTTIVLETDDGIKGFCVFGPTRDNCVNDCNIGEILALNVHPVFWRCGYGKFLCNSVLSELNERKWSSLTLWALKSNERAKLFYMSLGFKLDGVERLEPITEERSVEEVRYFINAN